MTNSSISSTVSKNGAETEILIIGAGASGLMAARESAKAGKRVHVLEARDRIGGRIFPLQPSHPDFGYPAQGGAEFLHGAAPLTKSLIKEAGLTLIALDKGETWSVCEGQPIIISEVFEQQDAFRERLATLKEDISIQDFFDIHMTEEKYAGLREEIIRKVQAYDAADPRKVSAFMIREEWFTNENWEVKRIVEGYGALVDFLASECKKYGATISLGKRVVSIEMEKQAGKVHVRCDNGEHYSASKVIVTVPLPVLSSLSFVPALPEKMLFASKIGFGNVIKIILRFKERWWLNSLGVDLSDLSDLRSREIFSMWWTQHPETLPVLTGWMAGPIVEKYKNSSDAELLDIALISLANMFKVEKDCIASQLIVSKVNNWLADPYARGAYSYTTYETKDAYDKLAEPIDNMIFFAGEALGQATATVEGALESGVGVVKQLLCD